MAIKIYVFGNADVRKDNKAVIAAKKLKSKFPQIVWEFVKPNQDLPFNGQKNVIVMDTIQGINQTTLLDERCLDQIKSVPRGTVHDFDLGFQLKYLKKLGLLKQIKIIGLPLKGKVDYNRISSILRKLVAQDMQGS